MLIISGPSAPQAEDFSPSHVREMGGQTEGERNDETQIQTAGERLGNGEDSSVVEASKPATSQSKKKKKRKRKSNDITGNMEFETSPVRDDNSPEKDSALQPVVVINGHIEPPVAELLEELPAKKPSKRKDAASKGKRVSKSSPAAKVDEDDGAADEEGIKATTISNSTAKLRKRVRYVKPRRSHEAALIANGSEPGNLGHVDAETMSQDVSLTAISDLPKRKKPKKSKVQGPSDELAGEPQDDHDGSADLLHERRPPNSSANIEPDAHETNLPTLSELQRDARLVTPSEAADDEEAGKQEPIRPSKEALGKRKAVDASVNPRAGKKAKRENDVGSQSQDLRDMGFWQLNQPRPATPSRSVSSIAERTLKLWEEDNPVSPGPAPTSNSQSSSKTPKSSWKAINNPADPVGGDEPDRSLFVPNRKGTERNVGRRCLKGDEQGSSHSAPSAKPQPTPAKSKVKTTKTTKAKEIKLRATPTSQANGKLSADDLDAISAAVESYREHCNLTTFQMNELIQSDAQMKVAQEMWKSICDEVPLIPRRTVQNTCRRKFHNFEARGAWTEEQDEELRKAYDEHPGKWKLIGETLNRFQEDVRDRWRNYLVCGDTLKKDAWNMEEEEQLRLAVKKCVKAAKKKHRWGDNQGTVLDEDTLIDWQKVSELMGHTRSRLQSRNKWKKLKDREDGLSDDPDAENPISESWRLEEAAIQARTFSAQEKRTLLRAIRDSGAAREGKIPWQTIRNDFDGHGKRMAWKYCFRQLRAHVPGHESMKFKDIVDYLIDVFDAAAPDEPDGYDLPIEAFAPSKRLNKKKPKSDGKRGKGDDGEESSAKQRKSRVQKQMSNQESDAEIEETPTVGRRTLRGRMLKEGESQESETNQGKRTSAVVSEDIGKSFQSILRTPKAARKRAIRKSKRNQALNEEKVVEDPSDAKEAIADSVNGDAAAIDHEENYTPPGPSNSVDDELDDDLDAEASGQQHDEIEDDELDADRPNAHHPEGSPDLDTPLEGRTFQKLGSPIYGNGYSDQDDEDDNVSSDDSSGSDIPATRHAKSESVEL